MPPGTGMMPGTAMRLGTGMMAPGGAGDVGERPMTSVQAAGYNSDPSTRVGQQFDPSGMAGASRGPAPPLQKKSESSTEEKLKDMERQVNALIEESAFEAAKGDSGTPAALEKAKEAAKKERVLCKQREAAGLVDQINIDLTYSVCFNLANQYGYGRSAFVSGSSGQSFAWAIKSDGTSTGYNNRSMTAYTGTLYVQLSMGAPSTRVITAAQTNVFSAWYRVIRTPIGPTGHAP